MPPKIKVTKKEIINAAVDIVRNNGSEAVNARSIAQRLECSTQPIFSNYATMESLRADVAKKAYDIYLAYREKEAANGKYPPYKTSGMAYIRFAREEKELFRLLFMSGAKEMTGCPQSDEDWKQIVKMVADNTSVSREKAERFHLEMWMFVHGVASMCATGNIDLDDETVSSMLSDVYLGLRERYKEENDEKRN